MSELREAAIVGVYMSKQGDLKDIRQQKLYWDCVKGALDDAGLGMEEVDGLIGPPPNGVGIRESLPGGVMADLLGHPLRFHATTTIGASSQAAAVGIAAMAIAHKMAEVVIIPTAASGAGQGYQGPSRDAAVEHMAKLGTPYEYVWGTTRVADYAVIARRHMHEYGTKPEQLAEIAVAQRYGATLNPLAVMGSRGPITVEDVMKSRTVADPLRILDCCIVNQGGGCMVMTSLRRAQSLRRHHPIVLLGYGQGHGYLDPNSAPSLTSFAGKPAADTAFGMAGVRRDEIDVAAIADHFTINMLIELEDAGFCKKGEGGPFVENQALRIGGRLPTNTGGGFLSGSHAASCGLFSLIELVHQLRHEAGPRQVKDAKLAFACGVGGVSHTQYSAILGRY